MAFLDPVLNPVLLPLIGKSPFFAILIISFVISLTITLVYKFVTDQNLMKSFKEKQKENHKRIKELRNNPDEMMKLQKESMKQNMDYMKHSFKPTLITMVPIILIFGWLAGHLSYEPIYPGESFTVSATFIENLEGNITLEVEDGVEIISAATQKINSKQVERPSKGFLSALFRSKEEILGNSWNLKSKEGKHILVFKFGDEEKTKEVIIGKSFAFAEPLETYKHSDIKDIQIDYNKLKPLGKYSILGWQPGWLGLYIIFSILFSMGLRKMLKIY